MPVIVANTVQIHPFRLRQGAIDHLVVLRSPDVEFRPSVWQVITGRCDPSERSSQTARRELLEETSLSSDIWLALPDPAIFYFEPLDQIHLSPVFACEVAADSVPVLSDEHVDYAWLPASQASSLLPFPTHRCGVDAVENLVRDPAGYRMYLL
jgi:8-oxo-dGTP pyrophosphatase MutT (NUDIX family)